MAQHFNVSETVARLEREANVAAGLSDEPLETIPDFDESAEGYSSIAEAEAALRASRASKTYNADSDGSNVRPSERCQTPSPLSIGCTLKAFHSGRHSWDKSAPQDAAPPPTDSCASCTGQIGAHDPGCDANVFGAAMLPGMPEPEVAEVPEPEPDDYDVPYEAQFNKADFKAAPGLKIIAERLISETEEFAHLRDLNIRYFWKRRGGLKGGNPRYGALTRPSGLAAYALGRPEYAMWLSADHVRDAKWIPRQFDAQIFDLLAHSAVDPDDHSAYRILGDDFAGMNLTLTHYGIWQDDLREAAVRMRQLDIEECVALADAEHSEAGQEHDGDESQMVGRDEWESAHGTAADTEATDA